MGVYPDKKNYGYGNMSDKDRAVFDVWHSGIHDDVFDFQKELYAYGRHDVVLLRKACLKYRREFMESTDIDLFNQIALRSCCMVVYKTHFLPRDTLALTHSNAYTNQHKAFSNVSIEWLEFVKTLNVQVSHALTDGEVMFGKYYLDCYYEQGGEICFGI